MLKRICLYLLSAWLVAAISSSAFAQGEKKTAYGVLLDNTLSMEKQLQQVILLGKGVVKRIYGRGPIALFNFKSVPRSAPMLTIYHGGGVYEGRDMAEANLGAGWNLDEDVFNSFIDSLSVVGGQTALLEAIDAMAGELNAKVNSDKNAFTDKVIILITDGDHKVREDPNSSYSNEDDTRNKQLKRLIKKLKESGITVYAVGLVRELDVYDGSSRMTQREMAELVLKKITKETGGRVIFPKSKKIDADRLLDELSTK
jgi:hypothetical protein